MTMKIHDEIDDWSAGALCDALSPEERQNFERHLAACPRCRALHEEDRKMNNTLKETMAEARPDANFERRIIDGFRGKIARPWYNPWTELHPWRGLVWLMHFRVAQAAVALLIAAAMVKAGSIITGDRSSSEQKARDPQSRSQRALAQQAPRSGCKQKPGRQARANRTGGDFTQFVDTLTPRVSGNSAGLFQSGGNISRRRCQSQPCQPRFQRDQ